jgi:hypothetical protein
MARKQRGYLPGGVGEATALFSGRLSTAISKYPSGRYGIVGSIPYELSEPLERAFTPGQRRSKVWETEQEVIDALLAIGVTKFQRADCSWYLPPTPTRCPDCGGELQIDRACVISEPVQRYLNVTDEPTRHLRIGRAALCSGCEYCTEF